MCGSALLAVIGILPSPQRCFVCMQGPGGSVTFYQREVGGRKVNVKWSSGAAPFRLPAVAAPSGLDVRHFGPIEHSAAVVWTAAIYQLLCWFAEDVHAAEYHHKTESACGCRQQQFVC